MNDYILKYRIKLLIRQVACRVLSFTSRCRFGADAPSVTLFISSYNTRYPLQLTLESLIRTTRYPNYRILIGENASKDGSLDYVKSLARSHPIDIIESPGPRMHRLWLNEMFQTVQTKYWCAIDSDMLFMGSDWLCDLIQRMEADPGLYLLAGEDVPGETAVIEPVGHETIDLGARFSPWLACFRTSLRDHMEPDFGFHVEHQDLQSRRKFCYDVGGKLLRDLQARGLKYAPMPLWFRAKYYHFGSLSWSLQANPEDKYQLLKKYQSEDIRRRLGVPVAT